MRWNDVRERWPEQWLVIEALKAHSEGDRRLLDEIDVVETCADGRTAFRRYRELRRASPARELLFVHTQREALEIEERRWLGVRLGDAAGPAA